MQFWVLLGLVRQLVSNNTTVENFVRQIISRSTDPLGRDSFTVDRLGGDGAGKGYYLLHVETTHEWGLLSVAPDTADIPRYFPWNMDRENEAQVRYERIAEAYRRMFDGHEIRVALYCARIV